MRNLRLSAVPTHLDVDRSGGLMICDLGATMRGVLLATLSGFLVMGVAPLRAATTTTYTYDARGRLSNVQVSDGAQRAYAFDQAGNRTQVQVSGNAGNGVVTLQPTGAVANATAAGVELAIDITGAGPLTGTVTFTENGVFIGSTNVVDGQASIFLIGFALGDHTITATYSGDASNAPQTFTFTIKVQNLSWLPAVLQILLSD